MPFKPGTEESKPHLSPTKDVAPAKSQFLTAFENFLDQGEWASASSYLSGLLGDSTFTKEQKAGDVKLALEATEAMAKKLYKQGEGDRFVGLVNKFSEIESQEFETQLVIRGDPQIEAKQKEKFWGEVEQQLLEALGQNAHELLQSIWFSITNTGVVDKSYINNMPALRERLLAQYKSTSESDDAAEKTEFTEYAKSIGLDLPQP